MYLRFPAFLFLLLVSSAATASPELSLPIACTPGKDCIVQNYVDHDDAPGAARDFICRHLTYDGHKGTDFRIPSLASDIAVLAAADGVIRGVRDGMDDIDMNEADPATIKNRECGNGVRIDHTDGWTTQYCHLKKGSIDVRSGSTIKQGDRIGTVGLSGETEFPHLHFQLEHMGQIIDPFTGASMQSACSHAQKSLWKKNLPVYSQSGLIDAGFTATPPDGASLMRGDHRTASLPKDVAAMIFWVQVFGSEKGDILRLRLTREDDGSTLASKEIRTEGDKAEYMAFIGRKNPAAGWPTGSYRGSFTLLRRQGRTLSPLISAEKTVKVSDQ